jgi:hypothetical protein
MTDFDQLPKPGAGADRPVLKTETATQAPAETMPAETMEAGPAEGPGAAAVLAAGVGALALGVVTTVSEMSSTVSGWLDLYSRVGPLSGKTIVTVVVWLLSWVVLHLLLRERGTLTRGIVVTAVVLLGLGLLGTFPTFFELFASD